MSEKDEKALEEEIQRLEEIKDFQRRIDMVWEHVENVRRAGKLMVDALIENGEYEKARMLATRISCHDASKFVGIQWDRLTQKEKFEDGDFFDAVKDHQSTNDHHPEFWGSISDMPEISLVECIVDWKARSAEQGTSLVDWIKTIATKKYDFNLKGATWKRIRKYLDLLLEKWD